MPLFVLTAQVLLRGAVLQGFKHVLMSQVPIVVLRPALLLASVWVTLAVGIHATPSIALAFNASANVIALALLVRYVRRVMPGEAVRAAPVNDLPEWLRVGYSFLFISAAQLTLSQSSDILLVAALLDRTSAAHYSVASQLAMLVSFASTAVMFSAAPLISELYAKQNLDTLRRFTRATATVCAAFSLTLFVAIAVFGRPLLGFFGGTFTVAYPALLVLAVTQGLNATIGALAGWLMTMTGHERPAAWMIGGSAVLNIALAFPLTVTYGLLGTATATLLATLLRSLMLSVYLRRKLGVLLLPGSLRR